MNRKKTITFSAISQDLSQQCNNCNIDEGEEWSVGKWGVDTQSHMGISV